MASKKSSPAMPMMDRDYQAQSDHRTMMDAAEIHGDKSRMTGVKQQHKKHMKKVALVQRQMMAGGR